MNIFAFLTIHVILAENLSLINRENMCFVSVLTGENADNMELKQADIKNVQKLKFTEVCRRN